MPTVTLRRASAVLRERYIRRLAAAGRQDDPHGRIPEVSEGSWLLIPYDDADQGVRPVPNGDPFWESPNILIDGKPIGTVVPGKPVRVSVILRNLGKLKAFGTRVDFAFVDASLGIPWSSPQPFAAGQKPSYVTVPATILGAGYVEVECPVPWVPAIGSVHACLFVMCSCAITNDQPTQPWSPAADRHVAQHNVNIVAAKPGSPISFRLNTINTAPRAASVLLATQVAWVQTREVRDALRYAPQTTRNALVAMRRTTDLRTAQLLATRLSRLLLDPQLEARLLSTDEVRETIRVGRISQAGEAREGSIVLAHASSSDEGMAGYTVISPGARLAPLQRRVVDLAIHVPANAPQGGQLLVRIVQFEDGVATGGYTFVIAVHARSLT